MPVWFAPIAVGAVHVARGIWITRPLWSPVLSSWTRAALPRIAARPVRFPPTTIANRAAMARALAAIGNAMEEADKKANKIEEEGVTTDTASCCPSGGDGSEGNDNDKKKQKEDAKIAELDEKSPQGPKDKKFNRQVKGGNFKDANKDFDELVGPNSTNHGNGIKVGKLSDGKKVNVRPKSKTNGPTLEIQNPDGRPFRKYRYE